MEAKIITNKVLNVLSLEDEVPDFEIIRGQLIDAGYNLNITRVDTETELRNNEEIFRCFMEFSPIYVFFKDENIRAIRLSKNYETMLGLPLNQLIGKNMDDLFPSDLAKSMIEDDKRILKEGKVLHIEEEFNGRFYSTIKFPIIIENKPRYLSGYTIDITERKVAEEALNEKINEMQRFHKLVVGRELKMIELKKEINELLVRLGEKEKYVIVE